MRADKLIFSALGFTLQYLAPVALFGFVVPYYHGTLDEGLTTFGYIAAAVIILMICTKIEDFFKKAPESVKRGLILSVFPIAKWAIVLFALNALEAFVIAAFEYWVKLIFFIIAGRVFYTLSEMK